MLLKILLFAGVIALVYFTFFSKKKSLNSPKNDNSMEEAMIPCCTCGVYIQAKEAIMSSGKYYCSEQCLKEAQ
jgi:uncharacterized protein